MKASQGLGFAFEGEDDGLNRQLSTTVKGFRSLEDMMPGMAKTFQSVGEGAGQLKERFQGAYGNLKELTTGGTLTTGLEGQIVSLNKDLRKMGVNAGLSGKKLSDFKSKSMGMSLGMKISAEEAGDAVKGWMGASSELKAVGIDSAQTLAKFANVSGMSASETVSYLKDLRKEFQFTDEDLKTVTQASMAMGQATGDVSGAMKDQAKTLELLRQKARGFGQELPTKELAKFAAGNAKLATMFYSVSGNADEAREAANSFSTTVLKARTDWLGSFAGMGGGFEGMFQEVGMSVGDIGVAMDSMKQGPEEFMQTMAKMVQSAKKNGKDIARPLAFMQAHMDKAFDPATSAKMTALFRNATDESLASMAATDKATDSLGEYAKKGFTAGWTLDESFTRAKETLDMSFRSIGRSAATNLVKNSGKSFKEFSNDLKGMAAKGGPIGTVITKFSEMSSIGALALLPEKLRPMGALFGTMSEKMGPVISQLGSAASLAGNLGVNLGTLGKIFSIKGMLLTGALAFGTYLYTLSDSGTGAAKVLAKISDTAATLFETVSTAFEKVPEILDSADKLLGQFFNGLEKGASSGEVKSRWVGIVTRLAKGFAAIIVKAAGMLKEAVVGFWQGLTGTFNAQSASGVAQLGNAFGQGLLAAWDWAVDFAETTIWPGIKNFAIGLFNELTGNIDPKADATGAGKIGRAIGHALMAAWDWTINFVEKTVWPAVKNFGLGLFDTLTGNIDPAADSTGAGKVGKAVGDALMWAWEWVFSIGVPKVLGVISDVVNSLFDAMVGYFLDPPGPPGKVEKAVNSAIVGALKWAVVTVGNFIKGSPAVSAIIGFMVGGPIGALAVLGLGLAAGALEDVPNAAQMKAINTALQKAGFEAGTTFAQAQKEGMAATTADTGKYGERLGKSATAALAKEVTFASQAASDQDQKWRDTGVQQLTMYTTHLDEVKNAWMEAFDISDAEATSRMASSLDNQTFFKTNANLMEKGYLTDLKVNFGEQNVEQRKHLADLTAAQEEEARISKARAQELVDFNRRMQGLPPLPDPFTPVKFDKAAFDAQVEASVAAYNKLHKSIGKGMGTAEEEAMLAQEGGTTTVSATATPTKKGRGKAQKTPAAPIIPGAPTVATTPEAPLFKYNKEEYKGYRDMISENVAKTAKQLDKPTQKLVGDVLNAAFLDAYNKIDLKTKEFADKETKVLGKLATDVKAAMGDMWITVLKQTAIATEAMTKDVTYIASQLKTVESAFTEMNKARAAAAATPTATDTPDLSARTFTATSDAGKLLEATRWPDWYDDYKKIFMEQMAMLGLSLKAAGTAAPVGGATPPASVGAGKAVAGTIPVPVGKKAPR